jgi:hypothetical protein
MVPSAVAPTVGAEGAGAAAASLAAELHPELVGAGASAPA